MSTLTCRSPLLTRPAVHCIAVRFAAGRWRNQTGRPPRYASPSPLADLPEFSFMDGRGAAPLSVGRRAKYLRDQIFGQEIIKYTDQMKEAKRLVPDDKRESLRIKPMPSTQFKY